MEWMIVFFLPDSDEMHVQPLVLFDTVAFHTDSRLVDRHWFWEPWMEPQASPTHG